VGAEMGSKRYYRNFYKFFLLLKKINKGCLGAVLFKNFFFGGVLKKKILREKNVMDKDMVYFGREFGSL
jgi:hypothetical protein